MVAGSVWYAQHIERIHRYNDSELKESSMYARAFSIYMKSCTCLDSRVSRWLFLVLLRVIM